MGQLAQFTCYLHCDNFPAIIVQRLPRSALGKDRVKTSMQSSRDQAVTVDASQFDASTFHNATQAPWLLAAQEPLPKPIHPLPV
jgi:hypothetical protein